jgi:hypothetical protein
MDHQKQGGVGMAAKRYNQEEIDICNFKQKHQCQHRFQDGQACMNVASPEEHFCRWHRTFAEREARRVSYLKRRRNKRAVPDLNIALIEDAESLHIALHEVIDAIVDGRARDRQAGHLLYALQLAQNSLKAHLDLPRLDYSVFDLMNELEEKLEQRKAARLARQDKKPPQSATIVDSKQEASS